MEAVMDYQTRVGDAPGEAHINYDCPCGCVAGVYHRTSGESEIGECCCGSVMAVGAHAEARISPRLARSRRYDYDISTATLPWGESVVTVLAVPVDETPRAAERVRDPVCGMMVEPPAAGSSTYLGTTYYFCAVSCKQSFDAAPERYVGTGGA
jgi:YHS domain-containing protein